ncbi:MAG: hypothetical protein GC199_04200 [Alphaproteobacteria bacterium]|nr:hypothetical protein [Alphaproteobacteria bacterium]
MSDTEPPAEPFTASYVSRHLRAVWGLLQRDPAAAEALDQSVTGFFRSFAAAILLLPLFGFLVLVQRDYYNAAVQLDPSQGLSPLPPYTAAGLFFEFVAYLLQWAAFPIAMVYLARLLGVTDRYIPFIVAHNWSAVPTVAITSVPFALFALGVLSVAIVSFLNIAAMAFAFYFRWTIAMQTLRVPGFTAAGLILIDVLLSLVITLALGALISLVQSGA